MKFDDCASIVHERRGTDDDAMDFPYKRIIQNTKPPEPCMFRGLLCFVRERQAATFKGELSVQMVPSKSFVTASVPFTLTRAGSSA